MLHDWVATLILKELQNNFSQVQEDVRNLDELRIRVSENVVDTWYELLVAI